MPPNPGAGVFHIREAALRAAQLPPTVNHPSGHTLSRPIKLH
jgi:hypothetical protein